MCINSIIFANDNCHPKWPTVKTIAIYWLKFKKWAPACVFVSLHLQQEMWLSPLKKYCSINVHMVVLVLFLDTHTHVVAKIQLAKKFPVFDIK